MKTIVTHNGRFHADEVFGCAVLTLLYPDAEIIRTRDSEVIASGDIVLDVGGVYDPSLNRFDHHQEEGAGNRKNGIPYASFGLIWKQYGEKLTDSNEIREKIDCELVQAIDVLDTMAGGLDLVAPKDDRMHPYFVQDAIRAFNSTWKEGEEGQYVAFMKVVSFARDILGRELRRAQDELEAAYIVEQAHQSSSDKRILLLDGNYPWKDVVTKHKEVLFVVQPYVNDVWTVHAVKVGDFSYQNRKDFPKAWSGKIDAAMAEASGVPDAIFCHRSLFLATARSKEGAIALAKLAIAS